MSTKKKAFRGFGLICYAAAVLTACATHRPPVKDYGRPNPAYDQQVYQEQQAQLTRQAAVEARTKKTEVEAKMKAYVEDLEYQRSILNICASGYATDHRKSGLTATELSEAAISNCAFVIDRIRQSAVDINAELHTNIEDRAALVQRVVDTSIGPAKGACLRALAEVKN